MLPHDPAERLAVSTRRFMDAVVRTEAAGPSLLATAEALDALTAALTEQSRPTMPWPTLDVMARGHRPYNPVIGELNPYAPPLRFEYREDGQVEGWATMEPIHEGPAGAVHGGLVASLLDQMLGLANVAAGVGGMTVELTIRYRKRTPFNVPLTILARNTGSDGRKAFASGEILADGEVTAEATGVFLRPTEERRRQFAEQYANLATPAWPGA